MMNVYSVSNRININLQMSMLCVDFMLLMDSAISPRCVWNSKRPMALLMLIKVPEKWLVMPKALAKKCIWMSAAWKTNAKITSRNSVMWVFICQRSSWHATMFVIFNLYILFFPISILAVFYGSFCFCFAFYCCLVVGQIQFRETPHSWHLPAAVLRQDVPAKQLLNRLYVCFSHSYTLTILSWNALRIEGDMLDILDQN